MATWIVPQGCCYACILRGGTDRYVYASGESVPLAHQPYATQNFPQYILVDFDNGYIYLASYNQKALPDEPLFIIDNDTQTVSCHPTNYATSWTINLLYAVASPYTLFISSKVELNRFQFGDGNGMLEISDFPSPDGISGTLFYSPMFGSRTDLVDMSNVALPSSINRLDGTFSRCSELTIPPSIPNNVKYLTNAFAYCTSLVTPPIIPSGITDMYNCFMNCTALKTPPVIPSGVTRIWACFSGCTSLTSFPEIPSTVEDAHDCFMGCTSIAGNCIVNAVLSTLSYWMHRDIFAGTVNDIYVVYNGSSASDIQQWETIVSQYSNVHYEANDNLIPSLSVHVTRVDSALSETQSEIGEYAYINATAIIHSDYLPVGWTDSLDSKTLTKDGTTIFPTWTQTVTDNTYMLKCWVSLGDIAKHTFTFQVTDDIKDANNTTKATHQSLLVMQSLSKAYKLVDYYHDPSTDIEGVSFGKFATDANLFDVDMPALFRDDFIVHKLVGEIKMYAGSTIPTGWLLCDGSAVSRTDYPRLFNAIGITYGSGDGSTTFNLPNLKGRFPLGTGSIDAGDSGAEAYWGGTTSGSVNCPLGQRAGEAWDTLSVSQMPAHNHLVSSGWQSASGQPDRITYGAVNGGYNNTASGNIQFIQNTGGGGAHNNMPPFTAINFIICAI